MVATKRAAQIKGPIPGIGPKALGLNLEGHLGDPDPASHRGAGGLRFPDPTGPGAEATNGTFDVPCGARLTASWRNDDFTDDPVMAGRALPQALAFTLSAD